MKALSGLGLLLMPFTQQMWKKSPFELSLKGPIGGRWTSNDGGAARIFCTEVSFLFLEAEFLQKFCTEASFLQEVDNCSCGSKFCLGWFCVSAVGGYSFLQGFDFGFAEVDVVGLRCFCTSNLVCILHGRRSRPKKMTPDSRRHLPNYYVPRGVVAYGIRRGRRCATASRAAGSWQALKPAVHLSDGTSACR